MVVDGLEPVEPPRFKNEVGKREVLSPCGSCHAPRWLSNLDVNGAVFPKVVHDMTYHKRVGGAKRAFQKMLLKGARL